MSRELPVLTVIFGVTALGLGAAVAIVATVVLPLLQTCGPCALRSCCGR